MTHPSEMTVREAKQAIDNGQLTSEKLIEACIERIDERDGDVKAWAYFDPKQALASAKASDKAGNKGAIGGIPVGVKDIIDTFDMPTEYGSPIYKGNQPSSDATCVTMTRDAGGVIMGKTATTEFAHQFPAATCNPHNLAHTPGGSSSGSGAGVASYMIPLGFGTQTGGSVIRPAAFCGVVGYKPTYGEFGLKGVKENAQCCDTVGLYARSVDDIALFRGALLGIDTPVLSGTPLSGIKVGVCRSHAWDQADETTKNCLAEAATELSKAGATVSDYDMSDTVKQCSVSAKSARSYELRRALNFEFTYHYEKISKVCREGRPKDGESISPDQYRGHLAQMAASRSAFADETAGFDILITPSATGEAPKGLETTGNSAFNDIWTGLHVPTMTIPAFSGPNGLPIGVQVVCQHAQDQKMFEAAHSIALALDVYEKAA